MSERGTFGGSKGDAEYSWNEYSLRVQGHRHYLRFSVIDRESCAGNSTVGLNQGANYIMLYARISTVDNQRLITVYQRFDEKLE